MKRRLHLQKAAPLDADRKPTPRDAAAALVVDSSIAMAPSVGASPHHAAAAAAASLLLRAPQQQQRYCFVAASDAQEIFAAPASITGAPSLQVNGTAGSRQADPVSRYSLVKLHSSSLLHHNFNVIEIETAVVRKPMIGCPPPALLGSTFSLIEPPNARGGMPFSWDAAVADYERRAEKCGYTAVNKRTDLDRVASVCLRTPKCFATCEKTSTRTEPPSVASECTLHFAEPLSRFLPLACGNDSGRRNGKTSSSSPKPPSLLCGLDVTLLHDAFYGVEQCATDGALGGVVNCGYYCPATGNGGTAGAAAVSPLAHHHSTASSISSGSSDEEFVTLIVPLLALEIAMQKFCGEDNQFRKMKLHKQKKSSTSSFQQKALVAPLLASNNVQVSAASNEVPLPLRLPLPSPLPLPLPLPTPTNASSHPPPLTSSKKMMSAIPTNPSSLRLPKYQPPPPRRAELSYIKGPCAPATTVCVDVDNDCDVVFDDPDEVHCVDDDDAESGSDFFDDTIDILSQPHLLAMISDTTKTKTVIPTERVVAVTAKTAPDVVQSAAAFTWIRCSSVHYVSTTAVVLTLLPADAHSHFAANDVMVPPVVVAPVDVVYVVIASRPPSERLSSSAAGGSTSRTNNVSSSVAAVGGGAVGSGAASLLMSKLMMGGGSNVGTVGADNIAKTLSLSSTGIGFEESRKRERGAGETGVASMNYVSSVPRVEVPSFQSRRSSHRQAADHTSSSRYHDIVGESAVEMETVKHMAKIAKLEQQQQRKQQYHAQSSGMPNPVAGLHGAAEVLVSRLPHVVDGSSQAVLVDSDPLGAMFDESLYE
ncbi:Hypothetical protein, putative [Bodo saltans]|uniref:Uncharacterized protein n=1 Tax=Bodo saltans TaxID=75058 RepID=A0A0S4KJN4_BODSA|nr:Hypothetical protein, putative [Bodo saltans]|eukprot:CUI15379.1 Hypothetical protein, putative [Bodo saltans]